MPIQPDLLVSAAMLQDYLVDNATGLPLANGTISLYQDNSRTTFKNWYYLSGSPGAYTFITLPNPMTLSGVGTIQDGNGNDVIPFYYPYSEVDNTTPQLYYIVVTNANGQQQFTRQDFPFGAFQTITPIDVNGLTLRNYIVNNVFWRNNASPTGLTLTTTLNATLAPSAHDGLTMPDWQFFKQATGAVDTLTFNKFGNGVFLNASGNPKNQDVTPEYYLNLTCSGTGPETYKYVQVPLSLHLKTLEQVPVTLVVWARCNSSGGTGGNIITFTAQPFTGTGTTSPTVSAVASETLTVGGPFTKTITQFVFPPSSNFTTGNAGDDAWYLQIGFPVGQTFSIDIAKVQLYIGNQIPSNDADLYDQVDQIISLPRTGDIRMSVNSYYPFGWVPMDDGTIGNASSRATTRANIDTWPLYSQLWNALSAESPQVLNIYTNAPTTPKTPSSFGVSAIADWNANKQLQLTQMLGRMLIGTAPTTPINITFTTNGTTTYTVTSGSLANVNSGMPVRITANTSSGQPIFQVVYYIQVLTANTFTLYSYFDAQSGFSTQITAGGSSAGNTLQIPDIPIGIFAGANFAQAGSPAVGYPASVPSGSPALALLTRPPVTGMNFYIKL